MSVLCRRSVSGIQITYNSIAYAETKSKSQANAEHVEMKGGRARHLFSIKPKIQSMTTVLSGVIFKFYFTITPLVFGELG